MYMDDDRAIQELSRVTGVKYSDEQLRILKHRGGMCILACAGSGKALRNGTGVLTPVGYVPIEKLKVGDICYDENGNEQEVIGVFPQGKKKVYKVVFDDGAVIECCDEHLWTYKIRGQRGKYATHTLGYILNNYIKNGIDVFIPVVKPVKFSKLSGVELPVKPYLLGTILSDACRWEKFNGEIRYKVDDSLGRDVLNRLNKESNELGAYIKYEENNKVIIKNGYDGSGLLCKRLRDLGLSDVDEKNKFIPDIYKYASVEDRLSLLNGVIDASGVYNEGRYEVSSISERFVDDLKFIVETLGMIAVKNFDGDTYRLIITPSKYIPKIHWCKEKDSRWVDCKVYAKRRIREVVETDEFVDMTCIKVSGESGLFVVEGCVITHNTTILTHLLAKRILTGEIQDTSKVLCTTYSKSGASEMEERLNNLLRLLGINSRLTVKTLHAFYLNVLRHFGVNFDVIDEGTRKKFILEACKESEIELQDEDLQLLDSLLSYQINNLLSDEALVRSYVYTLDNVSMEQYRNVRVLYNKKKQENMLIDFDDMQLYMYSFLVANKRNDIIAFCRRNWTDFYIDEAQDVSKIQFAILRVLVSDPSKLVFIGDDDQCIYQWRGADPSIIQDICGYFDIEKYMLSTNYRCPSAVVNIASKSIVYNKRRSDKQMKPFIEGGEVKICDTGGGDVYTQSKYVFAYIKDLIDKGVSPSDIAVLSRNNQHLSILNSILYLNGIYANIAPEMKLSNTQFFKDLRSIIKIARDTEDAQVVANNLWKVCLYLGTRNAKMIANVQNALGLKLSEVLGFLLKEYLDRDIDSSYNFKIPATVQVRINEFVGKLSNTTIDCMHMIYNALTNQNDWDTMALLLRFYAEIYKALYKSEDKTRILKGMIKYVLDIVKKAGLNGLDKFIVATEQYENSKFVIPGEKVDLCTVHGAKGREWKYVIIFLDDNVAFPSFEGIVSMIKRGISLDDISESIDEERRLHYVAMTRANKELVIFANKRDLSIFTLEALGIFNPEKDDSNAYIIDMASRGMLYRDLILKIENGIFNGNSSYEMKMSIVNVDPVNLENLHGKEYVEVEENKGDSLDDIKIVGVV